MRKTNSDIKLFINNFIEKNKNEWHYSKGSNFGIAFQNLIALYYESNKEKFNIQKIENNTNPNDTNADIVLYFNDNIIEEIEIKSCKDGTLNGVTICNSPELLNDKKVFLINYSISKNKIAYVLDIYETNIFRLTSINKKGKYKGCLISTRDTGKKIKGRNFKDFINSSNELDYPLEFLKDPNLIRKTILYYSVSKLIDNKYNFTNEEIIEAIKEIKNNE